MVHPTARGLRPLLFAFTLALLPAPAAFAQFGFLGGGGSGANGNAYPGGWPRYRQYRDTTGKSYTDITPTGRKGYFVNLGSPGFDDIGNGPSMYYSPIFNAPQPLPRPQPRAVVAPPPGAVPAAGQPAQPRPTGFFRRLFGRS